MRNKAPSEVKEGRVFFLISCGMKSLAEGGCRLTGDKSRAERSGVTRLMADCCVALGLAVGFEVSPAAQLKGGELTFGPGGKLFSPVNGHKPDFPLAHPQPLCVCPAAFTVDPGSWWKISRRLRHYCSYLQTRDSQRVAGEVCCVRSLRVGLVSGGQFGLFQGGICRLQFLIFRALVDFRLNRAEPKD